MKLTKNNLIKKLGETNSEVIEVVTKYNKLLPILSEDGEGFCINARDLHEQLKVKDVYSRWIKSNLELVQANNDEDYSHAFKRIGDFTDEEINKMSTNKRNSLGITDEYYLTMTCAKEICMVIGALPRMNKETKELSKIARKYFIYVEKLLKKAIEWDLIRKPEKQRYKELCEELKKYYIRNKGKEPEWYVYSNEADALNKICLGAKAKDIKAYIEACDDNTRDWLEAEYNTYLDELQKLDIMYMRMNFDKDKRYDLIKQGFKALYPNASFIIANKEMLHIN